MTTHQILLIVSEILLAIVTGLVARSNAIAMANNTELRVLKRDFTKDQRSRDAWKTEVTNGLVRNDRLTERNAQRIEYIIANCCLEKKQDEY